MDVLPLGLGKVWIYSFNSFASSSMSHTTVNDTGLAEYTVVGADQFADSTRWRCFRRRSFRRSYNGSSYSTAMQDSTMFAIIEWKSGAHELMLERHNDNMFFPLARPFTDSGHVFRYAATDSTGTLLVNARYSDPPTYSVHTFGLSLRADTGVTESSCRQSDMYYGTTDRHHLVSASQLSVGPRVTRPPEATLTSLVGVPKDTTILLANSGIIDLEVSAAVVPAGTATVTPSTLVIPGFGSALLTVGFQAAAEGVTEALLVLTSNAPTSPDTIRVTVRAMKAAVMAPLGWMYLGERPFSSKYIDTTFVVANQGNAPLTIEGISSRVAGYTAWVERSVLQPNEQTLCHLRWTPYDPSKTLTWIIVQSNSLTSPDSINVWGHWYGSLVAFESRDIDFGTVRVESSSVAAVSFRPLGDWSVSVTRRAVFDSAITVLHPFPQSFPIGERYSDSMLFHPARGGERGTYVVYTWTSSHPSDQTFARDTIWLRGRGFVPDDGGGGETPAVFALAQNYPNPFNPGNSIRYSLAERGFVSLEVFNILGERMATLVSHEQGEGLHSAQFDAGNLPGGVYIYRLRSGGFTSVGKMMLLR
jgi:hypothetical protein